jgi:hypothetical protein
LPSGAVGMTSIGGVTKLLYLSVLDYCWCRSLCAPPSDEGAIQLRWPFPAARAQGRAAEPGAGKRGGGPASLQHAITSKRLNGFFFDFFN